MDLARIRLNFCNDEDTAGRKLPGQSEGELGPKSPAGTPGHWPCPTLLMPTPPHGHGLAHRMALTWQLPALADACAVHLSTLEEQPGLPQQCHPIPAHTAPGTGPPHLLQALQQEAKEQ